MKQQKNIKLQRDYEYIHVSKTGGSSIKKMFGFRDREYYNTGTYDVVTSCRNPYDRFVSLFLWNSNHHYNGVVLEKYKTFSDFCLNIQNIQILKKRGANKSLYGEALSSTFLSQKWFIRDLSNVSYLVRYENFVDDINNLMTEFGIVHQKLRHEKKSKDRKPYQEYYNKKTLQKVTDFFLEDFEFLNYEALI